MAVDPLGQYHQLIGEANMELGSAVLLLFW